MTPPHSVVTHEKILTPVGMAISIVSTMNGSWSAGAMPEVNMPGARILRIVTKKFIPVMVELTPIRKIAAAHIDVPAAPCSDIGGYSVQPAVGAPIKNDVYNIKPAGGKSQKLSMFSHGNATSR